MNLESLVNRLGPVLYSPNRLTALARMGMEVDPAIPVEGRNALAADALGMSGRVEAAVTAGPSVPMSITVSAPAPLHEGEPRTIGGFDVIAAVHLSSIEAILVKLWEALVYPQDVVSSDVEKLFDVATLRSFFTGVPNTRRSDRCSCRCRRR